MKRLVIPCILILILALTSQVYAMGSHHGNHGRGGGGGSSEGATSSGTTNNTNNGSTGAIIGGTDGQCINTSVPELTTMFLLGSALFGLWGLRRKIKK
jgi:hypothetical protein